MARSNTGGTRGFLRGKVADDLYQVTKNRYGKRIQLVRSVEEQRQNNNTEKQALARMQMALLMGCLGQFKEIVNHSWETIPYGQLSIAHFVELNMPLIHEDSKNNWESDNVFDYPTKGISLLRVGAFIMAEGSLTLPSCLSFYMVDDAHAIGGLRISTGVLCMHFFDIVNALGINALDYITMLLFQYDSNNRANNFFMYSRSYLAQLPDHVADVINIGSELPYTIIPDSYMNAQGAVISSTLSDLYRFDVTDNRLFCLTGVGSVSYKHYLVGCYDAADRFLGFRLSYPYHAGDSGRLTYYNEIFGVPDNTSYILFRHISQPWNTCVIKNVLDSDYLSEHISDILDNKIVISKESLVFSDNVESCFTYDGNCNRFISFENVGGVITIANQKKVTYMQGELVAYCIVLSKWDGIKWCRNNAQFLPVDPEEPWRDLLSPNDVFQSWFPSYDPDNPHNPWEE